MTTYTEPNWALEFLSSDSGPRSYDQITLAAAAGNLGPGTVLGALTKRQAAAAIPAVVGTGNGAMSLLRFGPDVQVGNYLVKCITKVTDGGVFSVTAPDGTVLPNLTLTPGSTNTTAYASSHLSFSITDATDFEVNDLFTVAVAAGGTPVVVGGTGTGTMSSITLGKLAQLGTYRVTNKAAQADGGDFEITAPDGSSVGRFVMGTGAGASAAFKSDHVNFTLTDDTNFIVGNYFNIIVANHSGQAKVWDPTAVDGTQEIIGVTTHAADASVGTAAVTIVARDAELSASKLVWGSAVTNGQLAEAYRQMAARGLIVRS
jgi:hypothetical protein